MIAAPNRSQAAGPDHQAGYFGGRFSSSRPPRAFRFFVQKRRPKKAQDVSIRPAPVSAASRLKKIFGTYAAQFRSCPATAPFEPQPFINGSLNFRAIMYFVRCANAYHGHQSVALGAEGPEPLRTRRPFATSARCTSRDDRRCGPTAFLIKRFKGSTMIAASNRSQAAGPDHQAGSFGGRFSSFCLFFVQKRRPKKAQDVSSRPAPVSAASRLKKIFGTYAAQFRSCPATAPFEPQPFINGALTFRAIMYFVRCANAYHGHQSVAFGAEGPEPLRTRRPFATARPGRPALRADHLSHKNVSRGQR
jgi:hypothetical protein